MRILVSEDGRHMAKEMIGTLDCLHIEVASSREMIGIMSVIAGPSYPTHIQAYSLLDAPERRRRRWRGEIKYFGRGRKR